MHGLPLDINGPYKSPVYRRVLLQPPSRRPVSLILIHSVYPHPLPYPPLPQTSHCGSANLKRLFQKSGDLLPSFFPPPASARLHACIEFGGIATFSLSFGNGCAKHFFFLLSNEKKEKGEKKKIPANGSRGPHLPNDGAGEALLQLQWRLIVWCSALRQIVPPPVAGSVAGTEKLFCLAAQCLQRAQFYFWLIARRLG